MDGPGDGHRGDAGYRPWSQAFPRLARAGLSDKLRSLLEKAEAAHLESAALLRARRFGQKIGEAMADHLSAFPDGLAGDPLGWSVASRFGRHPVRREPGSWRAPLR